MTGFNKVFIDTAPFIYYLEKNPHYFNKSKEFFEYCCINGIEMVTSVITIEEYYVFPYKSGNTELIKNFESFISKVGIGIINIDKNIAEQAALIRAEFKDFKAMDSLQIASALVNGCDLFITNDKQLRQEKKIMCVTFDELEL